MKNLFLILLLITACSCFAQPGTLDPNFGAAGYVVTGNSQDYGNHLLMQPDGKILACGYSRTNVFSLAPVFYVASQILIVSRYLNDGSLDRSFGIGGTARIISGMGTAFDSYPTYALQPDGKILLSTNILNADSTLLDLIMYRLNSDGSLDTTFGTYGASRLNIDSNYNTNLPISVHPDGKILQMAFIGNVYSSLPQHLAIIRYDAAGHLDMTFGHHGVIDSIRNQSVEDIRFLDSGKILILSAYAPYTYQYNADGTFDTSFRHNLNSTTGPPGGLAQCCTISDDGDIYSCYVANGAGINTNTGIIKETKYGAIDTFQNGTDYTNISLLKENYARAVAVQPDGKILELVQTYFYDTILLNINTVTQLTTAIVRFTTSGLIDSTFATDGIFLFDTTVVNSQIPRDMLLQPDGRIVILGHGSTTGQQGFFLFRLLNNLHLGILDFTSTEGMTQVYPNPIHRQATMTYQLPQNETISIGIYDLQGREVQTLTSNEHQSKGPHMQPININADIASGNYILKINSSEGAKAIKIIVR